ncbi:MULTISPECIES: DUF6479 family protein [unclassified Streptomyces]|uniref:DUF6479 family protein n=1 Tax=unclassified Streptomyces TaxID=2593676 RepID=UPI0019D17508|nr:DUF6479 family protein [Streptomyces sp. A1136]
MNMLAMLASDDVPNSVWFLFIGFIIVAFLLAAFKLGQMVRAKEPPPPTPESHPHLPDGGAVYEVREERDPVEFPESGLRPHEMQGFGNFGSTTSIHPDEVRAARESGYQHSHPHAGQRPSSEVTEPPPPAPPTPPEPPVAPPHGGTDHS